MKTLQARNLVRRMRKYLSIVLASVVLLVLSGCSEQELYSGLSEPQANDMVALLYSAGMPANKTREAGGQFTVLTEKSSFASAVNLLRANGLPRESYDNLGEVFAKEGFVSSPLEERARLNHAMSQEIAHTISSIDGVLMARVHLVVPENNQLSDKVKPASASVFIKHRADVDLSGSVSRVKALVINGIENLPYDNVTVALFKAEQPVTMPVSQHVDNIQTAGISMPIATILSNNAINLSVLLGGLLLLGIIALLWGKLSRQSTRAISVKDQPTAVSVTTTQAADRGAQ